MAEQSFRILKLYNASVQEPTLGAIFREETPSLGVRDCAVPEFRINRREGKVNGQKKGVRVAGTRSGGGRENQNRQWLNETREKREKEGRINK